MNIKEILQNNFPVVNDAKFEKEAGADFLRVEVNLTKMDDVTEISRKISDFLDTVKELEDEYFLDIYSSGTDKALELNDLSQHIDSYVKVVLVKQIKDNQEFLGNLIADEEDKIIIKWNAKGQFRKQEILKENIKSVNLYAKA